MIGIAINPPADSADMTAIAIAAVLAAPAARPVTAAAGLAAPATGLVATATTYLTSCPNSFERNRVHPAVHQAIEAAIGAVPGLALAYVAVTGEDQLGIGINGWSPSLHVLSMKWNLGLRPAANADQHWPASQDDLSADRLNVAIDDVTHSLPTDRLDVIIADVMHSIRHHLAVQRRRAATAARLGHATPVTLDRAQTDVRHLTIDRATLALLARHHGSVASAVRDVARLVAQLHPGFTDDFSRADLTDLTNSQCSVHEEAVTVTGDTIPGDNEHPAGPTNTNAHVIATLVLPHVGRRGAQYGDGVLAIPSVGLPETLATALTGRPLADLSPTDPLLDHRTIAAVDVQMGKAAGPSSAVEPLLLVALTPDRIRIGDVMPSKA